MNYPVEQLTANATGKVRYADLGGRRHLVAPLSLIVPGVLNGSKGALYYPLTEINKNYKDWEDVPLTLGHPTDLQGRNLSARDPGVLERQGLGFVRRPTVKNKLASEGWFDVERVNRIRPDIIERLETGQPIELSTGLFTDNVKAPEGSNHRGKPYSFVARNYVPDHVAVLPDQKGACSLQDGCGVLVNRGGRDMLVVNGAIEVTEPVENALPKSRVGGETVGDDDCDEDDECYENNDSTGENPLYTPDKGVSNEWSDAARAAAIEARKASGKAHEATKSASGQTDYGLKALKLSASAKQAGDSDRHSLAAILHQQVATSLAKSSPNVAALHRAAGRAHAETSRLANNGEVTNERSIWQRFGEFLGVLNEKDALGHGSDGKGAGGKEPDHPPLVKSAVERVQRAMKDPHGSPSRESAWAWDQGSKSERDAVDKHLVSIKHPSASEAGTPENRFHNYVREVASRASTKNQLADKESEMSFATNGEMSHSDVHTALHGELQKTLKQSDPPAAVHSVFDKHMIYEQGGNHYKQGYSKAEGDDGRGVVALKGKPVKMLRQVSFTPSEDDRNTTNEEGLEEAPSATTNEEEPEMATMTANQRKEAVEFLTKKAGCCPTAEDAAIVGKLSDAALTRLVTNAKAEGSLADTKGKGKKGSKVQAGGEEDDDYSTETASDDSTKNEEWLNDPSVPVGIRNAARNMLEIVEREKAGLVQQLTANIADEGERGGRQKELLRLAQLTQNAGDDPVKMLRGLVSTLGAGAGQRIAVPNAAMFLGQASPYGAVANQERLTEEQRRDTLPTQNWDAVYEENASLDDKRFKMVG